MRSYFKKSTTLIASGFVLVILLFSCEEENPDINKLSPTKAIYYNDETREMLGERTFVYDHQGNLVLEYYFNLKSPLNEEEIRYEYDADANLIKKMVREPQISDKYYVDVFQYENGLKKSESSLYDGDFVGYRTLYFYSGTLADSTQLYYYSGIEKSYRYLRTTFYEYDAMGKIVRAYEKTGKGTTHYRYEAGRLKETCNLIAAGQGEFVEDCIENEYNSIGELVKISSKSPWRVEVKEELSYRDNVLDEKRIYTYPAYEPGNTIDVTLVKYQY